MKRQFKEILNIILYLVIILVVTILFIRFVMQRTDVSGGSMLPTLSDGDSLFVDKLSYRFKSPERFDIVVFPFELDGETFFIKRVIGLPGETVQITDDGRIWINGEVLEEYYGMEVIKSPGRASDPVVLGADEYFVMGDNRNNSMDSRDPIVGNVHKRDLIGKAWIRIWPFESFGILKHQ
ncbi:MAG: signal peptidase I [Lachnospiraceae bacterium]|nr:signal peptidase I [Lachnospiraceae bacterium]